MKAVKWIVIAAAAVIVVALLLLVFIPEQIVKTAVQSGGRKALDVPVHADVARAAVFSGEFRMESITIENPEGFSDAHAVKTGAVGVDIPLLSFLTSKPRIDEITVQSPSVNLEQGLTGSNLGALLGNAGRKTEPGAPGAEGRKVAIGRLVINDINVKVFTSLAGGPSARFTIPRIEMRGLGTEKGAGVTVAQTIALALRQIVTAILSEYGQQLPGAIAKSLSDNLLSFDQLREGLLGSVPAVTGAGEVVETIRKEGAKGLLKKAVDTGLDTLTGGEKPPQ